MLKTNKEATYELLELDKFMLQCIPVKERLGTDSKSSWSTLSNSHLWVEIYQLLG